MKKTIPILFGLMLVLASVPSFADSGSSAPGKATEASAINPPSTGPQGDCNCSVTQGNRTGLTDCAGTYACEQKVDEILPPAKTDSKPKNGAKGVRGA